MKLVFFTQYYLPQRNYIVLHAIVFYHLWKDFLEALQNNILFHNCNSFFVRSKTLSTNELSRSHKEVVITRSQIYWIRWMFKQFLLLFINQKTCIIVFFTNFSFYIPNNLCQNLFCWSFWLFWKEIISPSPLSFCFNLGPWW